MISLDILTKIFMPISLILMMIGLGTSLSLRQFRHTVARPRAVLLGLIGQLLLLPAVAFSLAWGLSLSPEHAMGLVIIACCPGGVASNIVSFAVRADVALSITLTSISTVASLITIPFYVSSGLQLFAPELADTGAFPVAQAVTSLAALILIPASLGLALSEFWPRLGQKVEAVARSASFPFLCFVMTVVIYSQWELLARHFVGVALPVFIFALAMASVGLALSRAGNLAQPQRRTIIIEITLQNTTVALLIALTFLKQPAYIIVPGCYGVMMFIASGVLLTLGSRKLPAQII